ncbi:MAG: hypothetical protein A2Y55_11080 [Actinobacteria bacterium RBG_16_68_12]|nr:MAG: hypothetical protein A2Y55_11080 [Actinobacteria bacterium RBG_16_68_12]
MRCAACGTENRAGRRFCSNCGSPLAFACPSCGAPNEPADRFCGECGSPIEAAETAPRAVAATLAAPTAERKVVSVLFADLVGFTSLSETRDPEEVRELLTQYFETSRTLIARYGGTVEKFIGDAVMAMWGAPIAREDDAERAVRAALDLTAAVAALGDEVGADGLAARAGVATGGAAVTLGAEGQGMVAGDLVNTASRVQSAAEPGSVLVTEPTRRASEASIVYEDTGFHELKGKAEPVPLARALRVIAGRAGSLRSAGLESPFVGRDRELRLMKELFHTVADEGKAHLLSVTGVAGIGKSRLSWEFFKYIDGLVDDIWWHRGRCISYGDGVTYWALAEMVRMRAGILEEEDPTAAAEKLRASVAGLVADEEERRFVETRLGHLLGLEERTAFAREDLFAAWRLFFERIAERGPAVLVFEDLQWGDESLLDFIEYLMDWSRGHRLLIVTAARPELAERRSSWAAGRRGSTSLFLEPLSDGAMDGLLRGMVPGLPDELAAKIRDRAEGIPLYAVETVRMLLDRGALRREGPRFELAGPVGELDVPETLQALIAARLDGLPPEERTLLQDAAVLGKTFTRAALADVTGRPEAELEPLLSSLVRKELLGIQTDPRSPERGQYGFLQSLAQKVAYDTLSKRDRKARHLAAAASIERSWTTDEDEIVEVVASHYLEAYRLAPEAEDADAIRAKARDMLVRAGRRAEALAATQQARGFYLRAGELADATSERAELIEAAAFMAFVGGFMDEAVDLYEQARAAFEEEGQQHAAARVSARIGEILWIRDRPQEGAEVMERAFGVLEQEEPDHDLATLAATLGKVLFFLGRLDDSAERIDAALRIAEAQWFPDVLSEALNTKGLVLGSWGRPEESLALLKRSLEIALENDVVTSAIRAYTNLSNEMDERDQLDEGMAYVEGGRALARRFGYRGHDWFLVGHEVSYQRLRGEWDAVAVTVRAMPDPSEEPAVLTGIEIIGWAGMVVAVERGDLEEAERCFGPIAHLESAGDVQSRSAHDAARATLHRAKGEHEEALRWASQAIEASGRLSARHSAIREGYAEALSAALELGEPDGAQALIAEIDAVPPGSTRPSLRALSERFHARVGALIGADDVHRRFKAAAGLLREIGMPFELAVVLLEHGEWLVSTDSSGEAGPLLKEAGETFERLGAAPYLERLAKVEPKLTNA